MEVSQQKDTNRALPMMPGGMAMESTANATTATARLDFLHPLLRGFGRSVAQAERNKAALSADAATLRTREAATTALRESLHAYWELVYAALEMEARRTSLTLAREQLEETRILVREGVRSAGELKAVEYSAAVREEASLAAQIQFEQRSLALRKVAGLGLESTDFRLWPVDRPLPEARRYDVTDQVKRGLARNPQLAALALDDRAAAVDEKVASDQLLPRLDLQVGTGVTGIAQSFDQSLSAIDGGQVDVSAGVQFSIELGRTAAHGSKEAARQRRRKVNIQREEANREVASAIVLAVHEIDMSGKRLEVASQAVDLARDNLESERARFRVGRSGNFDVLQRQDELDRARLARARAAADYHKAVVTLSALTGDLLEEYDVVVIDQ
jgi:outer membrane protein TolC